MPLKFEDLKLPEVVPLANAEIDMSEFLGPDSVLTFAEPDTAKIFSAREHAAQIDVNKAGQFPPNLCNFVALLVVSFTGPMPDVETDTAKFKALRVFFGDLAERRLAFNHLTAKFYEAFPAFANFAELKAESAKN